MRTMERSASVSRREVLAGATAAGLTFSSALGSFGFLQTGKVLIYDSKAGLFLNNDDANKALEVSYRQGFTLPV